MDLTTRLKDLTRPTGEEDLLAVKYPEPRLKIDPKQGMWVAVLCVLGLAGWAVLNDAPAPSHTFTPATSVPTPSIAVVSVVGEVSAPGLVTLTPNARVHDAVAAAGPLPEADMVALNLAEKVADGKQIVVPKVGVAPVSPGATSGKVSLNSATAADLEQLDGVGQKTAQAIIAHRDKIGGFSAIEQLQEVKGIGPAKFAAIAPEVTL
ncbi:ComE operon protein 1 [Corynebacterium kalinowskii]|uniref:ComE operon protein 1 n=1 Tax=Corynebacterium kalinowskii TaxID=2675216 RepID=A0A6B8W1E1_9CORY|nr:ComEA family DNA-binding protein [Corynebacterium kalinowskii]QGU01498.1 ComE operon protein 1 [Corynebacterium kalinowskii]